MNNNKKSKTAKGSEDDKKSISAQTTQAALQFGVLVSFNILYNNVVHYKSTKSTRNQSPTLRYISGWSGTFSWHAFHDQCWCRAHVYINQ